MYFCIRDDDTSFFTAPDDLERAYGEITKWGSVSLAIIPFCKAGTSKGVPEKYRRQWSTHPLHKNRELVQWLRKGIAASRFEPMLHRYYHDEEDRLFEFIGADDLARRVSDSRKYLEDLLAAAIRVFVPPSNAIRRQGLQAITREGPAPCRRGRSAILMGSIIARDLSELVAPTQMEIRWRTRSSLGP